MLIKVRVTAKTKENTLTKLAEDLYEAKVSAEATEGEANKALTRLLQRTFPDKRIRIISGARKPHKVVEIV